MSTVPLAPGGASGIPGFLPTHVVPPGGLATWAGPDGAVPTTALDPLLPVRLVERRGDWGRVLCSNGWAAWTDARLLVVLPQDPPAAGGPLVRTDDARGLLTRVQEALDRYRGAMEDLAAGRTNAEAFGQTARGLRIGAVVDGDAVWLYDAERDLWCYCDGTAMAALTSPAGPGGGPGGEH
ncbi:hypothetical protein GO001_20225 [Streptomyces sp. NRRL B-1677]|uniref:hypothetical protein n=1 Tax=Streptomyces TaxID=1883 RepID=UPI0018929EB4|nr:hypothetical protein [Streptomyces sp. NRRL B-1677]MBF6047536.1 hypothetical protein [Streptomyces sp. NRRL B-1677]